MPTDTYSLPTYLPKFMLPTYTHTRSIAPPLTVFLEGPGHLGSDHRIRSLLPILYYLS